MTMPADSLVSADAEFRGARVERPAVDLLRWTAAGLLGALAMAALVLCWRRLGGGLSRPLALPAMAVLALAVAVLAAAGRTARRFSGLDVPARRLDWPTATAVSAAVLGSGAAVSLPGTSPAALAVLWVVLVGGECWAWLRGVHGRRRVRLGTAAAAREPGGQEGAPARSAEFARQAIAAKDDPPEADVLQQLTRSRSLRGGETLSGWLRVPLSAGQRSASVHVAFCPPFSRTPKAAITQLEGPPARIKTVQLLPFGVRFDLKLASASQRCESLLLQFSAQSEPLESGKAKLDAGKGKAEAEKADAGSPPDSPDA